MKIVVFDELIEINAEHFEADKNMRAECERILYSYDVFDIVVIVVSKGFQYFNFDLTLFMQLLPILKNFQSHYFFVLVVIAANHNAEGTLSKLLLDLISVVDLFFSLVKVVGLVVVKAVVVNALGLLHGVGLFVLAVYLALDELADAFVLCIKV